VAIDTPYDDEFSPVLQVWVRAARTHGMRVWFRGNFSGWEGWFGYDKIDGQTHLAKTKQFILDNPGLFRDGDIFTSCPECENGANLNPGDITAVIAHRKFLIDEYDITRVPLPRLGKKLRAIIFL